MNTHDIELPPLPVPRTKTDGGIELFAEYSVREYARAAIEPYQRRIAELESQLEAIGHAETNDAWAAWQAGIEHAETRMNRASSSDSEIELPALPEAEIDDAGAFMSDAQVMSIDSAKEYARVAVEHDRQQRSFTKPSTNQDWLSLDPAVAFHLIERHAENWNDAGAMMQAYLDAHIEADRKRRGESVAYRLMRNNGNGVWLSDGRGWCEGRPEPSLVRGVEGDPQQWRIEYAYPAPQPAVLTSKDSDDFFTNDNPKLRGLNEPVKVNAIFETENGEVIGTTDAKVKRVEWQDDGSLTVVIDYWPQPAEPDEWKLAVDHELTNMQSTADSYPSAKEAVKALIDWHAAVANDPVFQQPAEPSCNMGDHACSDPSQCWEPCGELGKSTEHAKVAEPVKVPSDAQSKADRFRNGVARILGLGSEGGRFADTYLLGLISDLVELADEFHVRDERRMAMRETTYYLLYEHKEGFSSHPKKSDLRKHIKELDAENDRLHAILARYGQNPTSPAGWKLVPVEPTKEMRDVITSGIRHDHMVSVYQAMLEAAPEPPCTL